MTTHLAIIYHCQKCGSVSFCESDAHSPLCCGETMARAASTLVNDLDSAHALHKLSAQAAEGRAVQSAPKPY
ncbi:MAG TPA: hypothetical protein VHB77_17910 [Planctomycetaceae bacterium]|nr:hypothetical protein [Planctomycetaceae bacterium]